MKTLTENDAAEIEKFKLYMRAVARWDNAHDELPDFAPISEKDRCGWELKRVRAHADIYKQIYET